MHRIEEAIDGLRQGLNALTNDDGKVNPQMAAAIGCSLPSFEHTVSEMRWLLAAMERAQQRHAA
jgi:hypothetical protein